MNSKPHNRYGSEIASYLMAHCDTMLMDDLMHKNICYFYNIEINLTFFLSHFNFSPQPSIITDNNLHSLALLLYVVCSVFCKTELLHVGQITSRHYIWGDVISRLGLVNIVFFKK